jgi:pyridoxamine 5'-phosphate oxidase
MGLDELSKFREEYRNGSLSVQDMNHDPNIMFAKWFQDAISAGVREPNAMALATATSEGRPSVRMVLLKNADEKGFVFYTNYNSRKAGELSDSGFASVLFFWQELERQVRIEGQVIKVSAAESDAYFAERPFESRIGAFISPQSQVIPGREFIERGMDALRNTKPDSLLKRPEYWGGYRILPEKFEFWQGRENRLHDRFQYIRTQSGWVIHRLAP